jgi:hypothetical protein
VTANWKKIYVMNLDDSIFFILFISLILSFSLCPHLYITPGRYADKTSGGYIELEMGKVVPTEPGPKTTDPAHVYTEFREGNTPIDKSNFRLGV